MSGKSESGKKSKRPIVSRSDEASTIVPPMAPAKADAALEAALRRLGLARKQLSRRDLFVDDSHEGDERLRSYRLHRDYLHPDR